MTLSPILIYPSHGEGECTAIVITAVKDVNQSKASQSSHNRTLPLDTGSDTSPVPGTIPAIKVTLCVRDLASYYAPPGRYSVNHPLLS